MAPTRLGRPRDPNVDERALSASREIYAERGWSGYTMDEVSRRSGLGKGSLYLRWPKKADLLVQAIRSQTHFIADIDNGNLREDLLEFARGWYQFVSSPEAVLQTRLQVDARFVPELREALVSDPYPDHRRAARALVHRGIDRAELPPDTPVAVVADLIAGSITNHVIATPGHLRRRAAEASDVYLETVVDTVILGTKAVREAKTAAS
jgi:AcrR family transcriptional regulator